jgi:sulfoxide reductase catalytic subunit YedY
MLIRVRKPSLLTERDVTPERLYLSRRDIMAGGAAGAVALTLPGCGQAQSGTSAGTDTAARAVGADGALTFATTDFAVDDPLTAYDAVTGYNNFYEFGAEKEDPARYAEAMTTEPWSVSVDGHCAKPGTYDVEDLVDFAALEERIYRLRCVERWSMVIPWIGVPFADILAKLEPTSDARYVAFETYANQSEMRGMRSRVLEWPYVEGLRMDEAMHPLTLMAVGLYGKVLPNQNGAPMRLVVPWKYGYKSVKSIVRISFVENEPPTAWNKAAAREYGFYSNVNPEVRHPRWSQEFERPIGDDPLAQRRTEMFNGYAEEVAQLYAGMDLERFH